MQQLIQKRCCILLILIFTISLFTASSPAYASATQPNAAQPPLTPAEVQAFFDTYLGTQMIDHKIAGAAVSVVKDGQVIFAKGYGYADVDAKVPVDPDRTIFILGSLSKVFTWTAVMQLVEQGKLDLDADVNTYLDFNIPATFPEPITLNHLMAHTAGFEERQFGQMVTTANELVPLDAWLKNNIPARIYRPGEYSAYANYGTALAGYIVERASGMRYDDYVEKNILIPLGMRHTTSRQPIPAGMEAEMSQGYRFVDGRFQPQPGFNVALNVAPAGAFRASAGDMARFMLAHLNDGANGQTRILKPESLQRMHSQSFSHDPRVNGMAHGFWEMDLNDQEIIGHAGSHFIFNSILMLLPEYQLGVFVSTNSQGGMDFLGGENYVAFERAFVDHFFPKANPALTPPADFARRAGRYTGAYGLTMGQSETSPEKLMSLLMTIHITTDGKELSATLPDGVKRLIEIEPGVFRQVDRDALLVFHEDAHGQVIQAFFSPNAQSALIKRRWFETPAFHLAWLGICLLLFLSCLVVALVRSISRRNAKGRQTGALFQRLASWAAPLMSIFGLLVIIGTAASLMNGFGKYTGHLPLWPFVTAGSVIATLLVCGMVVFTLFAWWKRYWALPSRIYYTLLTIGGLSFVWFMSYWNILGKGF